MPAQRTIRVPVAGLAFLAVLIVIAVRIVRGPLLRRPPITAWPLFASAGLWVLFSVYWSAAAKNSAPAKRSESRKSRRIHEALLNVGLLLLFIPVPGMTQRFLPAGPVFIATGLGLQIASGLLGVWARRHLGRNWSGEITIKVGHELIRTGPYRILRHPIYTAMLGMFAGTTLVSGQTHALLGMVLVVFAHWRKIRLEEANLNEAFGPAYDAYRRETWALLPGLF